MTIEAVDLEKDEDLKKLFNKKEKQEKRKGKEYEVTGYAKVQLFEIKVEAKNKTEAVEFAKEVFEANGGTVPYTDEDFVGVAEICDKK